MQYILNDSHHCDANRTNALSIMNILVLYKILNPHYFLILCAFTGLKDHIESARALVDLVITRGPSSLNDPYALNNAMTVEASKPFLFIEKTLLNSICLQPHCFFNFL